jgi:large subunit ribosomal protein L21
MYAIIEASGKQFRAEPDSMLRLPRLRAEPGDTVTFEVLLTETDGKVLIGQPSLEGASVAAEVVRHGRGEKIIVFKRKRRKGYRKKQGHRQGFTEVRVTEITIGKAKPSKAKKPKKEEAPAVVEVAVVEEAPVAEVVEPEIAAPEADVAKAEVAAPEADVAEAEVAAPEAEAAPEIDITDAARKLADENGIDLAGLEGSGAGGRILKGDVEKAIRAQTDGE